MARRAHLLLDLQAVHWTIRHPAWGVGTEAFASGIELCLHLVVDGRSSDGQPSRWVLDGNQGMHQACANRQRLRWPNPDALTFDQNINRSVKDDLDLVAKFVMMRRRITELVSGLDGVQLGRCKACDWSDCGSQSVGVGSALFQTGSRQSEQRDHHAKIASVSGSMSTGPGMAIMVVSQSRTPSTADAGPTVGADLPVRARLDALPHHS